MDLIVKESQTMMDDDSPFHLELPLHEENDGAPVVMLEFNEPGADPLIFTLPEVPGADDQSEIVLDEGPAELEVSEGPKDDAVEVEEPDEWDWHSRGTNKFLHWLKSMIDNVPRHSGRDTTGLEKAIAYFEALDKEITKAMRMDYKNEIDSAKAEEARSQIEQGLDRLVERLEKVRTSKFNRYKKRQKKAEEEVDTQLVKEAQKHTHVGGIIVTVPLFISRLARTCINGTVSAGHNIEDMFEKLNKKYGLTPREQAELMQLLADMGYAVRRDRGYEIDEEYDTTSSDNFDWAANYPG